MDYNSIVYKYEYDGIKHNVSFTNREIENMVNATEMAKPFGKKPNDWLKLLSTKKYIDALSELKKIDSSDLVVVKYGDNGGTWMHEDVALEFARWLSPKFGIWCNDKIKQIIRDNSFYLKTTEPNKFDDHLFYGVQKNNSKAIARKNYGINRNQNKIVSYFRGMMENYIGGTPADIKKWARDNEIPESIINKGAREIIRYVSPEDASIISLIDNVIASNSNLTMDDMNDVIERCKPLRDGFKYLCEMGVGDYKDLKYIDRININNKKLND